jgi:zinc D-Ala-D-Ala carboxypeptidase
MKVTRNFSLEEIQHSSTASRLGIANKVPLNAYGVMKNLFDEVMQPLREEIGPIKVTSGYRCLELNTAIGGSSNSQHIYNSSTGSACDFIHYHRKITTTDIVNKILHMRLPFDQMILEYPESYTGGWVHVSYCGNRRPNRFQLMVKEGGKPYIPIDPLKFNKWSILFEDS